MNVQAEVSIYPLKTNAVGSVIDEFLKQLKRPGLELEIGTMSTLITGELPEVFHALAEAFALSATRERVVLVMKASNACPAKAPLR